MQELNQTLNTIKSKQKLGLPLTDRERALWTLYGDDIKAICAAADEAQAFGFRVCPRNVYADDIAKSICVCSGGKPCRNRFATCWKLYIKAAANNEHRAQ